MIDILVVLRAEDAVLDFLSVLASPHAPETHVLLCDTGDRLVLPPGTGVAERLDRLAHQVRDADEAAASPGTEALSTLIRQSANGLPCQVWTHSPADNRRSRGRVGRDTADAAAALDLPVRHAVGYSPFLQFVSDLDHPLDHERCVAKLRFVNERCGHLLESDSPQHTLYTGRVPATERFFTAGPDERQRLFALMGSLDDEAAAMPDPWEFDTSAYENERLDATTSWIARFCAPDGGPLVEVGACEGALTGRLVDKGFQVEATEPNRIFRQRLTDRFHAARPRIHADDFETLAAEPRRMPGAAYLLIEMLYYGQDLALVDRLPTDLVLVTLEPEALGSRLRPWLTATSAWEQIDETVLVRPALETVCGGRAYLSKRGSTGVVLRRASLRTTLTGTTPQHLDESR